MLRRTRILTTGLAVCFAIAVANTATVAAQTHTFEVYGNSDAPGYDYAYFAPPTLASCQSQCHKEPQCKAFTFNHVRQVCFLKLQARTPLKRYRGATTGIKIGTNRFSIRRHRDSPGHDYWSIVRPTPALCQDRCHKDPNCEAFTFNVAKRVCFLKNKRGIQLSYYPGAITGLKVASNSRPPSIDPSPPRKAVRTGTGSGFVVSGDGLILTNHHVVDGCRAIGVEGFGAGTLKAEDRSNDLALVKIEGRPSPVAFQTGSIDQGETVFVSGYPYGGELGFNFTNGIVSALTGPDNDKRYLQFTAPVQPGNSGGPLLDRSGHVVGVVVARLRDEVKPQNVNFAVQGDVAVRFLKVNGIEPLMASSSDALSPSEIAKRAKFYTYRLTCLGGD